MNKKRNIWIVGGAVLLLVVLVSAFVFMQPSAKDILVQTLETAKTIENGHAVVNINVDSPEEKVSATFEVWGRHGEETGAFRLEVLETDKADAVGGVIVSDGETVWMYSPAKNTVFTGTAEEAKAAMEEKQAMHEEFDMDEFEHPETAEEAVDKLFEYFDVSRTGTEQVANSNAYQLELKPIPEQMPSEYTAVGGLLNLWIDQNRSVPLAVEYTGGAMGEIHVTALELEINQGVDEALFTFEIPDGAKVVGFVDLAEMKPESLSLDEAADSVEFAVLTPDALPDGATLVDVLNIKGMIVQQYALTDGGSFSVAQGQVEDAKNPSTEEQTVEVRGEAGSLFTSEENDKVFLTWSEGDVSFVISGSLTAEQALEIAESLK
jgi:outer membrane lipoprotein-sorting protein